MLAPDDGVAMVAMTNYFDYKKFNLYAGDVGSMVFISASTAAHWRSHSARSNSGSGVNFAGHRPMIPRLGGSQLDLALAP
jgi:hypothetical protein